MSGLFTGMLQQILFNSINLNTSHIQIHKKGFNDNKTVQNFLPGYHAVDSILNSDPAISAYSRRVFVTGILSSANNSSGVMIYGIDPEAESKVSIVKKSLIEGKFIIAGHHDIVIGKKLAEKLGVGLGDKVVAMSNTLSGDIGSDVFRITGIFQTANSEFDGIAIYVPAIIEQNMLNLGDKYYEYAIITKDYQKIDQIKKNLESELGSNYEVLTYKDLLPLLIYEMEIFKNSMIIFDIIIGAALIFGIINSMLMSVFERINELGVLMAIGMKNARIYLMIVFEAFILGIIGTLGGIIVGLLIELPLIHSGINFAWFSAGLESIGVGSIIYPVLSLDNLIISILFMPFIAVLGSLYPAYRAIKLQPVYAINYV
jgi:ABC-type lipoprotein release transport system permease subunit